MNKENVPKAKVVLFYSERLKKGLLYFLLFLSYIVVIFSFYELTYILFRDILLSPQFLLKISQLLDIYSIFLLVLISLEVADSIKAYLEEGSIHVETVILVALTAMARKAFVIDTEKMSSSAIFSIAAIIISLSVGYYMIKKGNRS